MTVTLDLTALQTIALQYVTEQANQRPPLAPMAGYAPPIPLTPDQCVHEHVALWLDGVAGSLIASVGPLVSMAQQVPVDMQPALLAGIPSDAMRASVQHLLAHHS